LAQDASKAIGWRPDEAGPSTSVDDEGSNPDEDAEGSVAPVAPMAVDEPNDDDGDENELANEDGDDNEPTNDDGDGNKPTGEDDDGNEGDKMDVDLDADLPPKRTRKGKERAAGKHCVSYLIMGANSYYILC